MHYYKNKYKLKKGKFPNSNLYANTNISLPIYPKLSMKKVDFAQKIIQFLEHENKKILLVGGCGFYRSQSCFKF